MQVKQKISREQWRELDLSLQIDWVQRFEIKNIQENLPNIGQIMEYLEGDWIPYRTDIFDGEGQVVDKLWDLLVTNQKHYGQNKEKYWQKDKEAVHKSSN